MLRLKSSWVYRKLHPRAILAALKQPGAVFGEIYSENAWGGTAGELYSGSGSRGEAAQLYADLVIDYMKANDVRSVVDLGCGDFFIGRQIAAASASYVGVDVVPAVIERNRALHASDTVAFECLDIARDALPPADLCLVRQVFQHLSNRQIGQALRKLGAYRHVIVTEHFPSEADYRVPNLDKAAGVGTRVAFGSAVCLSEPPFRRATTDLLTVPAPKREDGVEDPYTRGSIRTFLLGGELPAR